VALLASVTAFAPSCDGDIATPPLPAISVPTIQSACTAEVSPGPAPIRRLTRQEYDRTIRDLVKDDSHPAAELGAEEEGLGFSNNAQALVTSSALVEKYMLAAEGISTRLSTELTRVTGYSCDPGAQGEDVCAGRFVDAFGPRAYRRALTSSERDALMGVFGQGRVLGATDASPFIAGLQLVIQAVLQSPDFLYRVEMNEQLTDFEIANRLSYLLWGTMPDEALLTAAGAGHLKTAAEIEREAKRLLAAPNARATAGEFHRQWLDYDRVHNVSKAASAFPSWSSAIPAMMERETAAFIEHVIFEGEGTWDALLTAPYSMMNEPLAAYYGVPASNAGSAFQKVAVDPTQRAGLLSQGSLMTINAHSNQTSPVHRGKLIRESFLCDVLAPPPKDVEINVPDPKPGSTARERFAQHSSNAACSGCHALMDPLGFPFEKIDGAGVYRSMDGDKPIDDSGEVNASDVPGAFHGVPGLARKLTASAQARRCYVKQWFRFAYGRGETAQDACSLERLDEQFVKNGRDIRALMLSLTQTDAFLHRKVGP